jgi:dTDP-4-amino-4,6-dideoxy-D-galactose acyltransferase
MLYARKWFTVRQTRMSDPVDCQFLEWDTDFFGVRVARIKSIPRDVATMRLVLEWCHDNTIDCAYLLLPFDDATAASLAQSNGFFMTDVRLTIERQAAPLSPHDHGSVSIRPTVPADVGILKSIARGSYKHARYYYDPNFAIARVDELYAIWTENHARQLPPQQVLTARIDDEPVGYTSFHIAENGQGQIDLLAVDTAVRGANLGRALVQQALQVIEDAAVPNTVVITQGRNIPAQRLFHKYGFIATKADVWFHRWFNKVNA